MASIKPTEEEECMEREFKSIEEIDRYLEEEFAKEQESSELQEGVEQAIEEEETVATEEEDTDEELVNDEEDEEDEEEDLDPEEDEEEPEEEPEEDEEDEEEPEEDPKPKPKRTKEDKTNHAFAKLRQEAKESKQKADEYDAVIRKLMREAGYQDFEQFKSAVEEQLDEKDRKEGGYTKEEYTRKKELAEEEARIRAREQALKDQERNTKAKVFNDAVINFSREYGLGKEGITKVYNRLEELHYTPDLLLSQPDPTVVIRGAMAEYVEKRALDSFKERESKKKKVDSGKISTRHNEDNLDEQRDKLIEKEMREYAKRKGIKYD